MAWRRGQAYSQDLRDRILAAEGSVRIPVDRDHRFRLIAIIQSVRS
jgi:hypothetical protein